MRYNPYHTVTRLGGSVSIQINDGPITRFESIEDTLVLSIEGEEVDRQKISPDEKWSIQISGGQARLVIQKRGDDAQSQQAPKS